jgi:large subunit ribosomal protein L19
MDLLKHFEQEQVKDVERPRLRAGDVVRVETKITEEDKTRLQTFEGTILMVRGSGPSTTFTVRRETSGFGVERIFPLYSPLITNIEIVKRQKVRRAKLSYLRNEGRRRFKEDVKAMQRFVKEEDEKKRLAEARRKAQDEEAEALREAEDKAEKEDEKETGKQGAETDDVKQAKEEGKLEARNPKSETNTLEK